MKIRYLLSGQDSDNGFESNITSYLKKDLSGKKTICFIVANPISHGKNDHYAKVVNQWFKKLNIGLKSYRLIDDRININNIHDIINKSDIIFLFGGNPFTQIKYLNDSGISHILRNFDGVVMGESAGAMNMSKTVYYSKDEDYPQTVTYEGMGLVDVTISPHFDINNKDEITDFIEYNKKLKIIGLPNESAVRISDSVEFIGDYYELVDSKPTLKNKLS